MSTFEIPKPLQFFLIKEGGKKMYTEDNLPTTPPPPPPTHTHTHTPTHTQPSIVHVAACTQLTDTQLFSYETLPTPQASQS